MRMNEYTNTSCFFFPGPVDLLLIFLLHNLYFLWLTKDMEHSCSRTVCESEFSEELSGFFL